MEIFSSDNSGSDTTNNSDFKNIIDNLEKLEKNMEKNKLTLQSEKQKILLLLGSISISIDEIKKYLNDCCNKLKEAKKTIIETKEILASKENETNNDFLNQLNELNNKIDSLNNEIQEKNKKIENLNTTKINPEQVQEIVRKITAIVESIPGDNEELKDILNEVQNIKNKIEQLEPCEKESEQPQPEPELQKSPKSIPETILQIPQVQEKIIRVIPGTYTKGTRGGKKIKISKKNKQDNSETETRNITSSIANIAGSKDTNPQYTSSSLAGSIKKRGRKSKKINKTKKSRKSKKSKKSKK